MNMYFFHRIPFFSYLSWLFSSSGSKEGCQSWSRADHADIDGSAQLLAPETLKIALLKYKELFMNNDCKTGLIQQ